MPDAISRFDGEYKFLSNFSPCDVVYNGICYNNTESAFQAQKAMEFTDRERIAMCQTPGEAKRAGRRVELRPDWEEIKVSEMGHIVSAKFRQDGDLARRLLATGNMDLIEGNTWNDTFWGTCNGKGSNWLGRLLMALRQELRDEQSGPSQSFPVKIRSIYGGSDMANAFVTLYGDDADTASAKLFLEGALKSSKKILLHGPGNKTWDEMSAVKNALEQTREATGIKYRIGSIVITGTISV